MQHRIQLFPQRGNMDPASDVAGERERQNIPCSLLSYAARTQIEHLLVIQLSHRSRRAYISRHPRRSPVGVSC